jgi:hypothetical protein
VTDTAVEPRVERWSASGDPHALWPGVTEAAFEAARHAIGAMTREMLSRADAAALTLDPEVTPEVLGVAAFATGLGPLLGLWLEQGRLQASDDIARVLASHLGHGRRRAALLDRQLGRVLDAFQSRGIEATLLKGMHTAWLYFPEPGTRPMSDIDLLVAPEHVAEARGALSELGFTEGKTGALPLRSEWHLGRDRQIHESLDLDHAENPWRVDLHVSLDRTVDFGIPARVGPPPAPVRLERRGRTVHVLPQPFLLASLAFHGSCHMGALRLLALVELVFVMRRDFADGVKWWGAFQALVHDRRIERFVYPALALSDHLSPGLVPKPVLDGIAAGATPLMRRVMRRAAPETGQQLYRRYGDTRLMWIRTPRDAWRCLTSLLHSGRLLRHLAAGRIRVSTPFRSG